MAKPNKAKRSRARITSAVLAVSAEAKIFMTGRSQAVRLPKEYRLPGDSVHIRRLGNSIVLTPKNKNRWAGLFAALDNFPRGFTLKRNQHQPDRAGLKDLFDGTPE